MYHPYQSSIGSICTTNTVQYASVRSSCWPSVEASGGTSLLEGDPEPLARVPLLWGPLKSKQAYTPTTGVGRFRLSPQNLCPWGGCRRDDGGEDAQEKEKGPGDHCVPTIGLLDAHPSEAGSKTLDLVINTGEAT
ncbi:hypothetical protein B296_00057535 [Ensete ventricosum]|uniref:Uncharacterized protein n=1 Tax=Ensete ventricosum TaxID=4639 RepID=A0A426WZU5_ENSVE|nr:hypothetical protein B296_00057535 [Ensete ventricosum]